MEVSEQRLLGNKARHRHVCGHLSFLLENSHCFMAEAPKPETLEQAPVHSCLCEAERESVFQKVHLSDLKSILASGV